MKAATSGAGQVTTDGGHVLAPFTYKTTGGNHQVRIDHKVTNTGTEEETFSIEVAILSAGAGSRIQTPSGWTRSTGPLPPGVTSGLPKTMPTFSLSWLMNITAVPVLPIAAASFRKACDIRRACRAT